MNAAISIACENNPIEARDCDDQQSLVSYRTDNESNKSNDHSSNFNGRERSTDKIAVDSWTRSIRCCPHDKPHDVMIANELDIRESSKPIEVIADRATNDKLVKGQGYYESSSIDTSRSSVDNDSKATPRLGNRSPDQMPILPSEVDGIDESAMENRIMQPNMKDLQGSDCEIDFDMNSFDIDILWEACDRDISLGAGHTARDCLKPWDLEEYDPSLGSYITPSLLRSFEDITSAWSAHEKMS